MTTEEKRTVELLRQNGKSNAEIAEHLHISPNTIKSYLKRKKRPANKSQPLKLKKQKKFSERKKDTTKRLPEQPKKFLAGRQP